MGQTTLGVTMPASEMSWFDRLMVCPYLQDTKAVRWLPILAPIQCNTGILSSIRGGACLRRSIRYRPYFTLKDFAGQEFTRLQGFGSTGHGGEQENGPVAGYSIGKFM